MKYAQYAQGEGLNWWLTDPSLQQVVARYTSPEVMEWARPRLERFGALVGSEVSPRADFTDRPEGRPRLVPYDRMGEEISKVVYNAGYLKTVADVYGSGIIAWRHTSPDGAPRPVDPAVAYAMGYITAMAESGFYCPVVLTASCALVVDRFAPPAIKERYLPGLTATDPDRLLQGATWLTEKTGGSDVGAITTTARYDGEQWRLTGEKWFASNADASVALALARPEGAPAGTAGLALFLVPRTLPTGERNRVRIRRLKEKLGVIAVPSGEVLLEGAVAYPVGEAGTGFKQMMEAINLSRVMNAIGSAGVARRAFLEAAIYTARRIAFGKPLAEHPLMQQRLLGMLVDVEAATALAFRAADCFERSEPLQRLLIPIAKARCADIAVTTARTGLECFGGNGYIEEFPMARLLRDAQVLTVWEGPENVLALDCLRVLAKHGPADLIGEIRSRIDTAIDPALALLREKLAGGLDRFTAALSALGSMERSAAELQGVRLLHQMADLVTASYLLAEATAGDKRKRLIATWYCDRFAPEPAALDQITLNHFDLLMDGAIG